MSYTQRVMEFSTENKNKRSYSPQCQSPRDWPWPPDSSLSYSNTSALTPEQEAEREKQIDAYEDYLKFSVPDCWEKFMEDYRKDSPLRRYPVRMDVINFIAGMLYNTGADPISIHKLFANGFCYHFAVILEHEFGGKIMWVRGCGHIVWMDENGLAYDIEGYRNDLDEDYLAPLEELEERGAATGNGIESFRHRYLELKPKPKSI